MRRSDISPTEVDAFGERMRVAAEAALEQGDWHRAYEAAKARIGNGGGGARSDPWLVYAASALIHGQPRIAIRALDLALSHWVAPQPDRAILRAVRGWTILESLRDPNTAAEDFVAAEGSAPGWLTPTINAGLERSRVEGAVSRKRKPSASPAPQSLTAPPPQVPRGSAYRQAGSIPSVWSTRTNAHLWEDIRAELDVGDAKSPGHSRMATLMPLGSEA
jgi:hypothetical protein